MSKVPSAIPLLMGLGNSKIGVVFFVVVVGVFFQKPMPTSVL